MIYSPDAGHPCGKYHSGNLMSRLIVVLIDAQKYGVTINLGYFVKKDANVIANSEDPDQTAPLGAV